MPPYVPRKRLRDPSPEKDSSSTPKARAKPVTAPSRKPTLFDNLDASSTPGGSSGGKGKSAPVVEDSDDDSLTSLSDADFEDVVPTKRRRVEELADDDEDEDIEFEDVEAPLRSAVALDAPLPSGDLELTLTRDTRISLVNPLGKKGPSKLDRRIRIATHCVHVQSLMWHNAIRNSWLCDPELQGILMSHVPERLWSEVERWRRNSGLELESEPPKGNAESNSKASQGHRNRGKKKMLARPSRDWGEAAERLEKGAVDMSHGDPLFRLMKALTAWWKQRFHVTAPGIRKIGYMSLERLDRITKSYDKEEQDAERFGEKIENLEAFRVCAQQLAGSRDVGAQLFTALLRALGLHSRMVASLQPLGFGWNKLEEADPEKGPSGPNTSPRKDATSNGAQPKAKAKASISSKAAGRGTARPTRDGPGAGSHESDYFELHADDSDSDVIIEIPKSATKKGKAYDIALEFPNYWTEVLSPVTQKYLSVDPIVKSIIGTNREKVELFEPRGGRADKARQVIAYVVGFSPDGTAKDVTVRYLKRQTLPGRTKGNRMPIEKVPVYNRHGKVKRYEHFDWFQSVMRGYSRGGKKNPFTEVDYNEDSADLKPAKPEKREVKEGEETLQYYKQSKDFVLERHLKREEALLPSAEPVKMFKIKGKGTEMNEEPVYSRKDVVQVKSAETWHKQGRAPAAGEKPLKRVPYRAATTNRRREIAEAERATGEKVLQGLYSFDQTDWIIPPPIVNGIIPKNEYGNIDLFVEHMCPQGAVHVPYRGAMRVCKRLEIDYAEAVVDFEFGHRMAVPVIQGVVIAEEHYDRVMEEIAKDEAERSRKEDEKRRKAAIAMWRKLLMGMRIVERIRQEYGDLQDDVQVFGHSSKQEVEMAHAGEDLGGGFLPEGFEVEEVSKEAHKTSGFFPVVDEEDDDGEDVLEIDHGSGPDDTRSYLKASGNAVGSRSKQRASAKAKKSTPGPKRRRLHSGSGEEDGEEYDDDVDDSDYNDT
ncbi:Rad4-domain-containing protein [Thozetella sp. PMI_491]|nr:Rad4-domain-containing protein [Thozetella sp. PMI_491]